jgi:hypothetical protein
MVLAFERHQASQKKSRKTLTKCGSISHDIIGERQGNMHTHKHTDTQTHTHTHTHTNTQTHKHTHTHTHTHTIKRSNHTIAKMKTTTLDATITRRFSIAQR